jgi:hypothetical protein
MPGARRRATPRVIRTVERIPVSAGVLPASSRDSLDTGGLLLLLLGILLLSGFVTGNLERWIQYAFDPARPPLTGPGVTTTTIPLAAGVQAGERRGP